MSYTAAKVKKATLKVNVTSSRVRTGSGMSRVRTGSGMFRGSERSRNSFSLTGGDSKVLDKSSNQTPRQTVQVLDEHGRDVTPQALRQPEPGAVQAKYSRVFMNEGSDFLSTFYQTTTTSSFMAPFSRSVFGSSTMSRSSLCTMESMTEEMEDPPSKRDVPISTTDVQARREEVKELLSEDMLEEVVDCYLSETDTISLLDMHDISVSVDAEDAEAIKERSRLYAELCKNRTGNDRYVERSMQTFNGAPKSKGVQSDRVVRVDAGTSASDWDMYDSRAKQEEEEAGPGPDAAGCKEVAMETSRMRPDKTMSLVSTASIASSSRSDVELQAVPVEEEADAALVLLSASFQRSLLVMERSVLENVFQPQLAAYRRLPGPQGERTEPVGVTGSVGVSGSEAEGGSVGVTGSEAEGGSVGVTGSEAEGGSAPPALERLWAFGCELTAGRHVSSLAWNKKNPDLLAVGYGQLDFKNQTPGLVCCWSYKNPTWPERVFHCASGVTALDFSASNPALLAVGMYDGSIATYNVQRPEDSLVIDSSESVHKHSGPVWQVRWMEQQRGLSVLDKGEALISVSADGRISKWFKGFDCIDVMKLKRTGGNEKTKAGEQETFISRQAPGLCIDFHPTDSNVYLVGTEEGHVHSCSCSNNEQFLETYTGHKAPLYRITWSPFCPEVFLSCSSDWTIQLWRRDLLRPVLGLNSAQGSVYDVMWSPRWATVFGAVNEEHLEIWDLRASILEPVVKATLGPEVKLTSLLFARQTDCVLVGDGTGQVTVYLLRNLPAEPGNQADILCSLASQL